MDFFQIVEKRRSVRKFSATQVPQEVIERSLDAALLAPNSSNAQTWDFYYTRNPELKQKIAFCCFSQSAARTASDIVVVTSTPDRWKRSWKRLCEFAKQKELHKSQIAYYEKIFPYTYYQDFLGLVGIFKGIVSLVVGCFRPVPRWPLSKRDLQEMSMKSASLAAENFVLAVGAQGYSTCMMEGFDSWRLKRLLKLPRKTKVVMVIAVGEESKDHKGFPRFRIGREEVLHNLDV